MVEQNARARQEMLGVVRPTERGGAAMIWGGLGLLWAVVAFALFQLDSYLGMMFVLGSLAALAIGLILWGLSRAALRSR